MNMWMIVTIETAIEWPKEETTVSFTGHPIALRPPTDDSDADVRMQFYFPENELETFELLSRFLTTLSWWQHRPVIARYRLTGSSPIRGGKGRFRTPLINNFKLSPDMELPSDPKVRIAIALHRETLSIDNTAYKFLSYFKIINVYHDKGKDLIKWMNNTLSKISDERACERLVELHKLYSDVGEYLYVSGRCAIAHAYSSSVVDPDKPEDIFRLSADMPVIRSLAEYLIENEWGVKWELSR